MRTSTLSILAILALAVAAQEVVADDITTDTPVLDMAQDLSTLTCTGEESDCGGDASKYCCGYMTVNSEATGTTSIRGCLAAGTVGLESTLLGTTYTATCNNAAALACGAFVAVAFSTLF